MEITFLGTGTGIPQDGRVQSGVLLDTEKNLLLFDCGCGVLGRIHESRHDHKAIDAIIITHLHLDHVGDILALLKANWLIGRTEMRIYGPQGTKEWYAKTMEVYDYLKGRFSAQITELSPDEEFVPEGTNGKCNCSIRTAKTVHTDNSLAYHIESNGKTVVYTGDTEPSEEIMELAEGADVLIHECSFPLGFPMTNHTTPDMLTLMMEEYPLTAKKLYLTHLYPHMQGRYREATDHIKKYYKGEVIVAKDLMIVQL
ncbi:Ribonuclease BN, tRNA processing enzyme [Methanolobus vulcani]|uniref:Ribonuclease BN, tRNA processing enzyme n=1 Tax=Methanolobus vulcani TaxID=38026 RepID=A0A7Z7B0P3_9EURY|nr:MBL fold metallo-hydrolase [Methanolobus vulcani]SDG15740.1 Ribonuclease BN, tRNA processing enzyme [Methanolobus vulcani]